jgi:hypothetical protein
MPIYKPFDFTRIMHASSNPLDAASLAKAFRDAASLFQKIEKTLYELEKRIEHLEASFH